MKTLIWLGLGSIGPRKPASILVFVSFCLVFGSIKSIALGLKYDEKMQADIGSMWCG